MKRQFKNEEAKMYYEWQEQQRNQDLPDHYIEMLNRIKKEALSLERKEKGSKRYEAALKQLEADKEEFEIQLDDYKNDQGTTGLGLHQHPIFKQYFNCLFYTFPAWKLSLGYDEESYFKCQDPHRLADYVFKYAYENNLILDDYGTVPEDFKNAEIKVVTIGEEYYKWLRCENIKDTEESSIMFANTVSNEEAYHMLQKYGMDHTYMICAMPLVYICSNGLPEKVRLGLSDDTQNRIKRMLSDVYGDDNFYFPGIVLDHEAAKTSDDRLYELAYQYFSGTSDNVCQNETQEQANQETNFIKSSALFIPFVVRYQHKSAVLNLKNIAGILDDEGNRNLLIEPASVLFKEIAKESEYKKEAHLTSISFNDYGIIDAIHKDLTATRGRITFLACWDYMRELI